MKKNLLSKKIYLLLFPGLLIFSLNYAQYGSPDTSFADRGILIGENYLGRSKALAIQHDGKIIAAGGGGYDSTSGFILTRYNDDGSIDLSFGDSGRAVANVPGTNDPFCAVTILTDKKILAAGTGYYINASNQPNPDIVLVRYLQDGKLDSSFGINGIIIYDFGKTEAVRDMQVQSDGKILLAGIWEDEDAGTLNNPLLLRCLPDGTLDQSFANSGVNFIAYDKETDLHALTIQPDGKIIIGGTYSYFFSVPQFLVARYNTNGSIDESFGNKGIGKFIFSGYSPALELHSIALQTDGTIICAGKGGGDNYNFALAAFKNSGILDSSFGTDGKVITVFDGEVSAINKIVLQPDGKIIAAGYCFERKNYLYGIFALAGYNKNGTLDSSFGTNGLQRTVIGEFPEACSVALQKDGKIVAGGYTSLEGLFHFALTRYNSCEKENKPTLRVRIKRWLQNNVLEWNAIAEAGIKNYVVERSTDGINFNKIAVAEDNRFTDAFETALTGLVYYRIKAIGAAGNSIISNVISAQLSKTPVSVKIYPNPVSNILYINGTEPNTQVSIADISGHTVALINVTGASCSYNISKLPSGIYLIKLKENGRYKTHKIVKTN